MKRVRVTCDVCGARVPRDSFGERDFVSVRMRTGGYGLQDGDHRYRFDVCSSACGIIAIAAALKTIKTGEDCLPAPQRSAEGETR